MRLLTAEDGAEATANDAYDAALAQATVDVVERQRIAGIDIVSDGEMSKISYSTYVRHRLTGFEVGPVPRSLPGDVDDFPELRQKMLAAPTTSPYARAICRGPIAMRTVEPLRRDIAHLQLAIRASGAREAFMTTASPGAVAMFHPDEHYRSLDDYLEAIAEAMRSEYEAIAGAGLLVQVDSPDLAMGRHVWFKDSTDEEFLRHAAVQVEVLNHALRHVPAERSRLHICWGNYEGPHTRDIPLDKVLPLLLTVKPAAVLVEAANPRHEHEWRLWRRVLPDDKVLVPGVIDTSTNIVEHPELVAQRIRRFAALVGRERVIAGTDCGFATFAGASAVHPEICWAKLATLREGADRATQFLWRTQARRSRAHLPEERSESRENTVDHTAGREEGVLHR
jgi:5-methyltetrahydropteroyltriglutamate--homocysteine methyltransferase